MGIGETCDGGVEEGTENRRLEMDILVISGAVNEVGDGAGCDPDKPGVMVETQDGRTMRLDLSDIAQARKMAGLLFTEVNVYIRAKQ